ncbi:hypothetical protein Cgig2_010165 [Carnegiea gigantea]|uniref:Uncharacterized protein n=1 Tax=Carnegiea gigantea TaxID=171969 RepID=A0A9Q1KGT4_9CARY|nr:hypothetical protein Cgig2_010165 [Carnegiea gigantea]
MARGRRGRPRQQISTRSLGQNEEEHHSANADTANPPPPQINRTETIPPHPESAPDPQSPSIEESRSRRSSYASLVNPEEDFPDCIEFASEHNVLIRQQVIYEWKPIQCKHYKMYGHLKEDCRKKKPIRQEWRAVSTPANKTSPENPHSASPGPAQPQMNQDGFMTRSGRTRARHISQRDTQIENPAQSHRKPGRTKASSMAGTQRHSNIYGRGLGTRQQKQLTYAILTAGFYHIWQARNTLIFDRKLIPAHGQFQLTKEHIKQRILFLNSRSHTYSTYIDHILI